MVGPGSRASQAGLTGQRAFGLHFADWPEATRSPALQRPNAWELEQNQGGLGPPSNEFTPVLQLELSVENVKTVADLNLEVYPVLASFKYRKNNSFSASTSQ